MPGAVWCGGKNILARVRDCAHVCLLRSQQPSGRPKGSQVGTYPEGALLCERPKKSSFCDVIEAVIFEHGLSDWAMDIASAFIMKIKPFLVPCRVYGHFYE